MDLDAFDLDNSFERGFCQDCGWKLAQETNGSGMDLVYCWNRRCKQFGIDPLRGVVEKRAGLAADLGM